MFSLLFIRRLLFVQPLLVPGRPCPEYLLLESVLWLFLCSTDHPVSTSISQNFLPPRSLIGLVKVPHPDPIPPERILNKSDTPKSTINGSFAFVKDPTPLAERIPYISPVASLLEALPTQNASVSLLLQ